MPATPHRWLRHFWFQITVSVALAIKGIATTDEVFAVLPAAPLWPYALWGTAAMVLASTFVPFHPRIQATTGALLGAIAMLRITSYLLAVIYGELSDRATAVAWYLIALWAITGAVGAAWPRLTTSAALAATVENGRADDA